MKMVEDKVLLALLKKGDRDAFDVIFKKYASRLYFFSLSFFNNKTDADEIVQDTFLKIWETRARIDENQHFNTYLITIGKNIIYNHFRHKLVERKYNEQVLHTASPFYSIEHEIAIKSLKEHLFMGMDQLPPQQREILLLKRKGFDNGEIAQQLKLSKRTIETHINKAFKFLRLYLMEHKDVFLVFISLAMTELF